MPAKHSLKLSKITWLTYTVLACWALLCLGAGVFYDRQVTAARYHELAQNTAADAQQQLTRLKAELNKLRAYPLILANQSDVKYVLRQYAEESDAAALADHPQILQSPAKKRLDTLLQILAPQLRVSSIFVVGPSGYIISSSRGAIDPESKTSFNYRDYFGEAIAGVAGEQFAVSKITGVPAIFFSYPVRVDDTDVVAGIVVIRVDGSAFADNFVYGSAITFITDRNGVVMLSTRPDFFLKTSDNQAIQKLSLKERENNYSQQKFKPLPVKNISVTGSSYPLVEVSSSSRQTQYIQVSKPIPKTGWRVHILFPVTGVLEARQYSALLVFCVFIAVMLVFIVIERLLHYAQTLREQSRRDPLTRLYNRYYMQESLATLCALHDRGNLQNLTALMLDLNHFKLINDNHGHMAGDNALRRVARTLVRQARRGDIVCRMGGEEFLLIMAGQPPHGALSAAERLRQCIETIHTQKPPFPYKLTVSGGLTQRREGEPAQDFLQRADKLLYQAKNGGRNRVSTDVG